MDQEVHSDCNELKRRQMKYGRRRQVIPWAKERATELKLIEWGQKGAVRKALCRKWPSSGS